MEIFQIPENIVDRRKHASPILKALSDDGVIFQIRSVFLQGLLIAEDTSMNPRTEEIKKLRNDIEVLAKKQNINSDELCLRYGLSIDWVSQVVIGFENYEQYRKNLEIITNNKPNISFEITKGSDFLVDPRNWS
jgi:aryl-alcohol dehydrogenase-like predicted oxidoreductase